MVAKILVVDDEQDIRDLVKEILEDEGYVVDVAEDGETARKARRTRRPDVILLDIWMPDVDGISLLREWSNEGGLDVPVIMISGHATVDSAVEATKLGAYDFIEKPIALAKLLLSVERALEASRLSAENRGYKLQMMIMSEPLGRSQKIRTLKDQIKRIAQHNAWILMLGEAGSGKEVCARYLHSNSSRQQHSFNIVNVASQTREGHARTLFGSEESDKIVYGQLEQAGSGTVYIDDIGDLNLDAQAMLVHALETRSFRRVGSMDEIRFESHIIAASRYDLKQLIKEGRFREDLYYQLNVVPLHVPPLREHGEDVPDLLSYYVDYFTTYEHLPFRRFSVAAQNSLRQYAWPGNIRELRNLVQRVLILGDESDVSQEEIERTIGTYVQAEEKTRNGHDRDFELPLREARERFEKRYITHHLEKNGGNVSKVAEKAGLERTHLYRKLKSLGISTK